MGGEKSLKLCQGVEGHIARCISLSAVACYYHRDKIWSLRAETFAVTEEDEEGGGGGYCLAACLQGFFWVKGKSLTD